MRRPAITGHVPTDPRNLREGVATTPTLRAELLPDETGTWHFRVPAPHIIGGGTGTRDDAEREQLDAVAYALEGDPADYDDSNQVLALEVSVSRAV